MRTGLIVLTLLEGESAVKVLCALLYAAFPQLLDLLGMLFY
jgi:hypothetical protein